MRYCPSCHIDFTGVLDRCPLCGSKLEGTPEGMIFPENELARTKKLAKRSMIALTFAALAFVAFLCVRTHASAVTGIASFAAVIVNYIFIRNVVVHSPSFLRIIERYFLVVMALALLLLLATGDSRLATYVVPALTLVLFSSTACSWRCSAMDSCRVTRSICCSISCSAWCPSFCSQQGW